MFTELSLGCWSSGHRNSSMYQVLFSTVVFFVSYMHIHMPIKMYWPRLFSLFSEKYIVYIILTMPMFIGSRSFISLPSFMFVGAAVSEIRESNRNKEKEKKNLQNGYFQFNTFPRHISDPFFHHSYLLTISTH